MRASDKFLAVDSKMLSQEYEYDIVFVCQAMGLNIKLIKQIIDAIPDYATPTWDVRTAKYIQKLQDGLKRLEDLHQVWYYELLDNTVNYDITRCFAHDIRVPLSVLQLYCQLLERFIPKQDTVLFMLDAIEAYVLDMRYLVDDLFDRMRNA
jgi:signal transduction histidine kinase